MESNWRMNVWRLGLNDGWCYLAGRSQSDTTVAYVASTRYPKGFFGLARNHGGDQGWRIDDLVQASPLHPHFPFGQKVLPD